MLHIVCLSVVLLSFFTTGALADCKPNTTDFTWKQCMDSPIMSFSAASLKPYPLNPNTPPDILTATYTINDGVTLNEFIIDLDIQWFGEAFGQCGWHSIGIPIHGLSGCSVIDDCPLIGDGKSHSATTHNLSGEIAILEAFHPNTYYSLRLTFRDEQKNQIGCIDAFAMIV